MHTKQHNPHDPEISRPLWRYVKAEILLCVWHWLCSISVAMSYANGNQTDATATGKSRRHSKTDTALAVGRMLFRERKTQHQHEKKKQGVGHELKNKRRGRRAGQGLCWLRRKKLCAVACRLMSGDAQWPNPLTHSTPAVGDSLNFITLFKLISYIEG